MAKKRKSGAHGIASKKRRKRTSLQILKTIIVLGVLFAVIFYTPVLKLQQVTVSGNSIVDPMSVINAAGITPQQHMLKINYKEVKQNVEKIAYVSTVKLEYNFWNVLNIHITEGNIIASVKSPGGYVSIDENSEVLEINENPKGLPVIEGLNVQKNVVGDKITIDESDKFDIILVYLNILKEKDLKKHFVNMKMDGYSLILTMDTGIKVICGGKDNADYKISALLESLKNSPNISIGTFDVTNPKRVVYNIN